MLYAEICPKVRRHNALLHMTAVDSCVLFLMGSILFILFVICVVYLFQKRVVRTKFVIHNDKPALHIFVACKIIIKCQLKFYIYLIGA
jgi:hypothetical protein